MLNIGNTWIKISGILQTNKKNQNENLSKISLQNFRVFFHLLRLQIWLFSMKQFKGKRKSFSPFTRKPHKMVKNAQTIRRLYPTLKRRGNKRSLPRRFNVEYSWQIECVWPFCHFVRLALKGLRNGEKWKQWLFSFEIS